MIWWLVAGYVALGLFFVAIGLPLARRRVPPNGWYGFRAPKTLNDRTVWFGANAYSGRLLIGAGIVSSVTALFTTPLVRDGTSANITTYAIVNTAVLTPAMTVVLVRSFRYLRTIP